MALHFCFDSPHFPLFPNSRMTGRHATLQLLFTSTDSRTARRALTT